MFHRRLLVLLIAVGGLLLSGCGVVFLRVVNDGPDPDVGHADSDWVVVTYTVQAEAPADPADALSQTGMTANEALQNAGAGSLDSDKADAGEYLLYFVGSDRHQMWRILEPVLAKAPVRWSRVELYRALGEDPDEVIRPR